jgi:hypothetical protein
MREARFPHAYRRANSQDAIANMSSNNAMVAQVAVATAERTARE